MGGRLNGKHDRLLDRRQFRTKLSDDRGGALRGVGAILVGFQANDEESLVRRSEMPSMKSNPTTDRTPSTPGNAPDDAFRLLDDRRRFD